MGGRRVREGRKGLVEERDGKKEKGWRKQNHRLKTCISTL